jgi:hypothetical protein
MGGWGSGRHWNSKETTTDYRRFDIHSLRRGGWLQPGNTFISRWYVRGVEQAAIRGRSESDRIVVSYRHQCPGKPWETLEYPIFLDRTRCHYGGTRAWFLCPAQGCGRRVGVLYSGRLFLCRHCRRLVYGSQREPAHERALNRVLGAQERMGWKALCADDGLPPRRKGMHHRTFERLARHFRLAEREMNREGMMRFGAGFGL